MDASELQQYKRLLLRKQEELLTEFDTKALAPAARPLEGDHAKTHVEADLQISLRQADNQTLREIEGALARITRGTFGECEVCKAPLSQARLKAIPWARRCRECQEEKP